MASMKMNEVAVQVVATLVATAVLYLVTQTARMFHNVRAMSKKLDEALRVSRQAHHDFNDSHMRFSDGEWHHRRSDRV